MRKFNNSICTSDDVRKIKQQRKKLANNPEILAEYNKVVEDTKIAIENLTEYINSHELLNELLLKIQQEDSSFLVGALGLTKRGNNSSYYRGYLALDAQNIIEFRAADHYETESTVKDKTNNKAQYLFQVVMVTKPPKKQSDNAITGTGRIANINVITRTITSESTIDELVLLLKAIRDYLRTPSVSYDNQISVERNNKTDKNESKNMTKKNTIRLTESELKRVITESVQKVLNERYEDEYDIQEELMGQIRGDLFSVLEKCDNNLLDAGIMAGWAYEYISYVHKILKQILPYNQWVKQNKN